MTIRSLISLAMLIGCSPIVVFADAGSVGTLEAVTLKHASMSIPNHLQLAQYEQCRSLPEITKPTPRPIAREVAYPTPQMPSLSKDTIAELAYPPKSLLWLFALLICLWFWQRQRSLSGNYSRNIAHFLTVFAGGTVTLLIYVLVYWSSLYRVLALDIKQQHYGMASFRADAIEFRLRWITPLFWSDNPVKAVALYAQEAKIVSYYQQGKIDLAATLAANARHPLLDLQEQILMAAASRAKSSKNWDLAEPFGLRAFELKASTTAFELYQTILAESSIDAAEQGQFDRAIASLDSIHHWQLPLYVTAQAYLARQQIYFAIKDEINASSLSSALESARLRHLGLKPIAGSSAGSSAGLVEPDGLNQLTCDHASMAELLGQYQLEERQYLAAIDSLLEAKQWVKDSPVINMGLARSYQLYGLEQLASDAYDVAITALSSATEYDNDNADLKCDLSRALLARGLEFATLDNQHKAQQDQRRAKGLCDSSGNRQMDALISLKAVESNMKLGLLNEANLALLRAMSARSTEMASTLEAYRLDLQQTKARHSRLQLISKWANIPNWTGSMFTANRQYGENGVTLYNGLSAVGQADADFREVYFGEPGDNLLLADSNGDGLFNVWRREKGNTVTVLLESDGDFKVDTKIVYIDEVEQSREQYSGRVSLQIPGAVIAAMADWFSEPDAYLVVSKNQSFIGQSPVVQDSVHPGWDNSLFVVNYTLNDSVGIEMKDKDVFYDEHIDNFYFNKLPQSGVYAGAAGKAAIELVVKPTALAEGYYYVEGQARQNIFAVPKGTAISHVISNIMVRADKEKTRAQLMQQLGENVLIDLINPIKFKPGLLNKLHKFMGIGILKRSLKRKKVR